MGARGWVVVHHKTTEGRWVVHHFGSLRLTAHTHTAVVTIDCEVICNTHNPQLIVKRSDKVIGVAAVGLPQAENLGV